MAITFKPFTRRDGAVMLYINRDNGVSVGISADFGFSPYGKNSTPGKRNAMNEAHQVMADAPAFTGDLSKHAETGLCAVAELADGWTIVGTDTGSIGGMPVGADGGYIIHGGRIARCGVAHSV